MLTLKMSKAAPRRKKINRYNRKSLIWLVLFAPVGLTMMWKRKCSWKTVSKWAVTALVFAVALSVIFVPMPKETRNPGIYLIGAEPEAAVYGPALPTTMVEGFVDEAVTSYLATDEDEADVHYVYAADGARCYHEYECKFAYASSQRLTVYEAYFLGYEPCGKCNPPLYDGTLNGKANPAAVEEGTN